MEEKREKQLLNEKEELRKRKSDKEALLNDLVNHQNTRVNPTLFNFKKTKISKKSST